MEKTRILFLYLLAVILTLIPANAYAKFSNETLNYVVSYKWGVIHKDAGNATLSLRNKGGNYSIKLTAKTKPWADKVFKVRDTLVSTVRIAGFKPLNYAKITHEGGKYAKDVITYKHAGNKVTAHCARVKVKKGKRSNSSKTLTATGKAFDMLSIFYYLRSLDFPNLKKGHIYRAYVFSGKQVETISIKCLGTETIKLRNKKKVPAYHIRFNFTSDGKKKSSADMDTWISTDARHIPLLLEGSLPVGKVKCYYTGG